MTLHMTDVPRGTSLSTHSVVAGKVKRNLYARYGKRLIDISLVLLAAPIVLPLVAIMALIVAMDGNSPFYSQKRVGRVGKEFSIWKMRSMIVNADKALDDYLESNPDARVEWDTTQKLKHDPRITYIGRILRKTSMDELPQLFNVLTGSMSLVGPRPIMVSQKNQYTGRAYYTLRPGITGLWQISDRNNCDFVDRVAFDDQYAKGVSFSTDLRIMFKTLGVVMRATGH